jgi:hypothetical protein
MVLDETATVSKIYTVLTGIAMGNISFLPILIRRTHGYWYRKKVIFNVFSCYLATGL